MVYEILRKSKKFKRKVTSVVNILQEGDRENNTNGEQWQRHFRFEIGVEAENSASNSECRWPKGRPTKRLVSKVSFRNNCSSARYEDAKKRANEVPVSGELIDRQATFAPAVSKI